MNEITSISGSFLWAPKENVCISTTGAARCNQMSESFLPLQRAL